jgi:hypothetical protein
VPILVNGLGGEAGFGVGVLAPNDDGSTGRIDLTPIFGEGGLNFFGSHFTSLYVNNNGNVTFQASLGEYVPEPIGTGIPMPIIAPLWFDIDTRGGPDTPTGGNSTGSNLVYYNLDTTHRILTVTWDDVGYYSSHIGRPDAFQLQLIDTGGGNFDIAFIYQAINQDTSDTAGIARAGFSPGESGNGAPLPGSFELPGSGTDATLSLATTVGNTGVPGYWLFHVSDGVVTGTDGPTSPPPISFSLSGTVRHTEGDSGVTPFSFTIHRTTTDLSQSSVVDWQLIIAGPDAAPGGQIAGAEDFASGQPLSGAVTFAAGQVDATVTISVQNDHIFEPEEVFQFALTGATIGTVDATAFATGIIHNDTPATQFAFTGPQYRLGAAEARPMDFTVLRSGDTTQAQTLHWQVDLGAAGAQVLTSGQALAGTIDFAAYAAVGVIELQVAAAAALTTDKAFALELTSFETASSTTGTSSTTLSVSTTGTILHDVTPSAPAIVAVSGLPALIDTSSFMQHLIGIGSSFDESPI